MKVTDITIEDLNYAIEHFFDGNNEQNPVLAADEDRIVIRMLLQSELYDHVSHGIELLTSFGMDSDMIAHAMVATGIRVGLLIAARRSHQGTINEKVA